MNNKSHADTNPCALQVCISGIEVNASPKRNGACSDLGHHRRSTLEIHVISSLTLDDEARYAATFLKMLAAVLDSVPTTYAIHVQLADGAVVEHGNTLSMIASDEQPPGLRPTHLLPLRP